VSRSASRDKNCHGWSHLDPCSVKIIPRWPRSVQSDPSRIRQAALRNESWRPATSSGPSRATVGRLGAWNQTGGLFVDGVMSGNAHAPVTAGTSCPVAELYASEQEGLRRLARLLTGSDAMAEDLVQEAFVRLQASPTCPNNPGGYLRTVLVNLCRDHLRRQARARHRAVAVPLVEGPPEVDETWAAVCRLGFRQRASRRAPLLPRPP
jgi:hypothetical protein